MMEQMVFWAVQGVISVLLTAVAYFLKATREQIDRDMSERKKETDKLRDELTEMKSSLPRTYVLRDDYIRTMADFGRKLDRLLEQK